MTTNLWCVYVPGGFDTVPVPSSPAGEVFADEINTACRRHGLTPDARVQPWTGTAGEHQRRLDDLQMPDRYFVYDDTSDAVQEAKTRNPAADQHSEAVTE